MHDLDETDLRILELLAEDARRPYSDIGDRVDLSGPAVSDRVQRLRASGVIRRLTVDVDRSRLRAGAQVLVAFDVDAGDDAVSTVRDGLVEDDAVEYVLTTAEGEVQAVARVAVDSVREWAAGVADGERVAGYSVTLLADAEWTPSVGGTDFALACAECGNTVTSEGESARIDGDVYHFCCPSCLSRFEERYQRLAEE